MVQQNLEADETVTAEASDGTKLVRRDDGRGSVLEYYDHADGEGFYRTDYDRFKDAKLHYGLWVLVDGFERPDRGSLSFMPTEVVSAGRPAQAAWLYVSGGRGSTVARSVVTDRLGVDEDSVSTYLSEVRKVAYSDA